MRVGRVYRRGLPVRAQVQASWRQDSIGSTHRSCAASRQDAAAWRVGTCWRRLVRSSRTGVCVSDGLPQDSGCCRHTIVCNCDRGNAGEVFRGRCFQIRIASAWVRVV